MKMPDIADRCKTLQEISGLSISRATLAGGSVRAIGSGWVGKRCFSLANCSRPAAQSAAESGGARQRPDCRKRRSSSSKRKRGTRATRRYAAAALAVEELGLSWADLAILRSCRCQSIIALRRLGNVADELVCHAGLRRCAAGLKTWRVFSKRAKQARQQTSGVFGPSGAMDYLAMTAGRRR